MEVDVERERRPVVEDDQTGRQTGFQGPTHQPPRERYHPWPNLIKTESGQAREPQGILHPSNQLWKSEKTGTKIRMITVPAHLLHRVLTIRDIPRDHVHPVTLIVSNASRNGGSKRPTSESQYGEKRPIPKFLPATPLPGPPQSAERTRRNDRLTHPTRRNCTANRFSRCHCCAWLKSLEERRSIRSSPVPPTKQSTEASSADLDHL